ncbi:polyadenylation factor subunit 2 [Magnaporthiopsis poae ATCC 64411]|uniref:Polyadenylation factor subunit 2 n=1 Tax=Magnaporthiopsis poae (strain ATCC 64411 / 73-15) TaxID=644358 RepID=A0A0C4DTR1_MAGP6|nr:polyadenylation factor subunit 2 [Magnaporthiopsis poae ATCC 64411]
MTAGPSTDTSPGGTGELFGVARLGTTQNITTHRNHLTNQHLLRIKGPVTDYSSTLVHWMRHREARYKGAYHGEVERPSPSYIIDMLPPHARVTNAADSLPVRHLHSSLNKVKHPINVVKWTPEGRRLLTASSGGEFTLWNGTGFNFETIMQAHEAAIRACAYSHRDEWLLSGDHDGIIHYWQPNFNNVETIRDSKDTVRDMAFSPNDSKFVVATDDAALRVYDFAGAAREATLSGHHWETKACDWHPTKGLIVSGSKDHLVKLWDPRSDRCLTTLRGHKNTITKTVFERVRGMCLATSARDQTARTRSTARAQSLASRAWVLLLLLLRAAARRKTWRLWRLGPQARTAAVAGGEPAHGTEPGPLHTCPVMAGWQKHTVNLCIVRSIGSRYILAGTMAILQS